MKNFPIQHEGKTYWISRSVAVAVFVYRKDAQGNWTVLITKRGKGCPTDIGKWCCPCGYLDFDESVREAALRELHEETGIALDDYYLNFLGYDDKNSKSQNVTLKFNADVTFIDEEYLKTTTEFNEPDEVDEIVWLPIAKVDELEFAFNHSELIKKYIPE